MSSRVSKSCWENWTDEFPCLCMKNFRYSGRKIRNVVTNPKRCLHSDCRPVFIEPLPIMISCGRIVNLLRMSPEPTWQRLSRKHLLIVSNNYEKLTHWLWYTFEPLWGNNVPQKEEKEKYQRQNDVSWQSIQGTVELKEVFDDSHWRTCQRETMRPGLLWWPRYM